MQEEVFIRFFLAVMRRGRMRQMIVTRPDNRLSPLSEIGIESDKSLQEGYSSPGETFKHFSLLL